MTKQTSDNSDDEIKRPESQSQTPQALVMLGLSPREEKTTKARRRTIEFKIRGGRAGASNLDEVN